MNTTIRWSTLTGPTAVRPLRAATTVSPLPIVRTVGPRTITLRPAAPNSLGFTHDITVWTAAAEDDALAFDMAEGAPLLTDEAGAYDLDQATQDFNDFVSLYTARADNTAA